MYIAIKYIAFVEREKETVNVVVFMPQIWKVLLKPEEMVVVLVFQCEGMCQLFIIQVHSLVILSLSLLFCKYR